ncbi:MAG: hypothetical protein IT198_08745 [Acidimicrobiia bacterium]|nr:hypothetical protein [Acidimicrobiia bacterium]
MIERFVLVVAACLVFAACQTQSATDEPGERSTTTSGTATGDHTTLLSQPSQPPPEGVPAVITATVDEGGRCSRVPDTLPFLYTDPRTEVGLRTFVCLFGYDEGGTLVFSATGPDGGKVTAEVDSDDLPEGPGVAFHWVAPPDAPTGNWQLEARLGEDVDGDNIAVGAASYPHVAIVASPLDVVPRIRAGDPVDATLTGFPPRTDADLHLYRAGDDGYSYVTTLTVPVDASGMGEVQVETGTGDPTVLYCFTYAAGNFDAGQVCSSTPFRLT